MKTILTCGSKLTQSAGGGDGDTVTYLMSHFLAGGDQEHFTDMAFRKDHRIDQHWASPAVSILCIRVVYIVTSKPTFSAAEECAYDFQALKRASIVGETTDGGTNPSGFFSVGHGLVAFILTGQSVNPITHTNWEGVGVKPDLAVPLERALDVADAKILRQIVIPKAKDDQTRSLLTTEAERQETGDGKKGAM